MLVPIVVLVVALAVGWLSLQSQTIFPLSSFWYPEALSVASSSAVLGGASLVAYVVCLRLRPRSLALLQGSSFLRSLRGALFEGFYFDRVYDRAYRGIVFPVANAAAKAQTELLRMNAGLALLAVAAVIFLFVAGVL